MGFRQSFRAGVGEVAGRGCAVLRYEGCIRKVSHLRKGRENVSGRKYKRDVDAKYEV